MLIFDELKKNDPQLRLLAGMLAGGLFILLAGLWWVQVVSAHEYQSHLDTQSSRTVRLPALRGKILDREGRVLAENRPRYNLSLYLDDLRNNSRPHPRRIRQRHQHPRAVHRRAGETTRTSADESRAKAVHVHDQPVGTYPRAGRYRVASAVVSQISQKLGQPLMLDPRNLSDDY